MLRTKIIFFNIVFIKLIRLKLYHDNIIEINFSQ